MKKSMSRLVCFLLALVLCVGLAAPAGVAQAASQELVFKQVENLQNDLFGLSDREYTKETTLDYNPKDMVRVSIVLEDESTVMAGYPTTEIAANESAMAYRNALKAKQDTMAQIISAKVLGGKKLDVVWNLTLVGNIISANVPFGKIEQIANLPGVASVCLEQQYEPQTTEEDTVQPNMASATVMTGANAAWLSGLTGAGSRVAIIDTGTDTDHQSFDVAAYLYALEQNALAAGVETEEYVAGLNLLDKEEITSVLEQLNAYERTPELANADSLYYNEKLPFNYNYIDKDLDVTHDNDSQGGHGSHVAGIAVGNRFIPKDDGTFGDALEMVYNNGVAPDAQLITMKVFGKGGGAYEADYMAAIEDAIILGCDVVNLSLGSGSPGATWNSTYQDLLDSLSETDTVVSISAGNSGYWTENAYNGGYPYYDGVSFATGGSPGTYTNSIASASVDNGGVTGPYFQIGDIKVVFNDRPDYGNAEMITLDTSAEGTGTEYEFVMIDAVGEVAEYDGLDLTGKIAFCNRGVTSFFEKANAAVSLGAVATVVCNNQPGVINMNLTGYEYTAPCVSITQAETQNIRAALEAQVTDSGVTYYTGTVTVYQKATTVFYPGAYIMSSFSSWGVPSSLIMKPEITTPGGSILSVNGETPNTNEYVQMSGTSMAAPHTSGLVALVAQYLRESGIAEQEGMSPRHLAHSLLMSTAEPLLEEASGFNYYSILNQGSGLANINNAISAQSYVLVDGQEDGKVKFELGDDPDREGVYTVKFTLNSLSDEDVDYSLDVDTFTQDVFAGGGQLYLDTWTTRLLTEVKYYVDGNKIASRQDIDGDGMYGIEDAQELLEYILTDDPEYIETADINGDGYITSYDAYLLLAKLESGAIVTVPAGESVEIEITIVIPEDSKEYLDMLHPNGTYVEGFVYAAPVTDEEGVEGVTHSIPVLGYYGSWTDPSMFDCIDGAAYMAGEESRIPYLGLINNYMSVSYDGSNELYYFGGNPYVLDEEYLPARNAFNNCNGGYLDALNIGLIRNAGNTRMIVKNETTGEILADTEMGARTTAYYYVNGAEWRNAQQSIKLGWKGTDANGEPLPDGTDISITYIAAPEYYRNEDGTYNWDALNEGAYLRNYLTIDSTAPVLESVSLDLMDGQTITVTAQDNEYIAAIALLNGNGTRAYAIASPNQTEAGVEIAMNMDINDINGDTCLVAVYDYAMNATTYEIQISNDKERAYFTAFDRTNIDTETMDAFWVGFNADENEPARLAPLDMAMDLPRAAEYVEGHVFMATNDNLFYVAKDSDLSTATYISDLMEYDPYIAGVNDMAYNEADGNMYALFYSYANSQAVPYLCTIDMFTGVVTILGETGQDFNNLAIDPDGNFYSMVYGADTLYTYTADTFTEPTLIGNTGYSTRYINSMAWDTNTDTLYWACNNSGKYELVALNTETGEGTLVRELNGAMVGLYILPSQDSGMFDPTDEVAMVKVTPAYASMLKTTTMQLEVQVLPWNVTDTSVIWESADETIATVDENGVVTGVGVGTTQIFATSALNKEVYGVCELNVDELDLTLNGVVWDEVGEVWFSEFTAMDPAGYQKLTDEASVARIASGAYGPDGMIYGADLDTATLISNYYQVDPATFEATLIGGSSQISYMDMAWAPNLADNGGLMLAVYGPYVVMIDQATGEYSGVWNWGNTNLVGISYYGSQLNTYYGAYLDMFLIQDVDGNVYLEAFIKTPQGQYGYFYGPEDPVANLGAKTDSFYFNSSYFDGQYYIWSRYSEEENISQLIVWDCEDTGNIYHLGDFGDGVWPVGALMNLEQNPAVFNPEGTNAMTVEADQIKGVASFETENLSLTNVNNTFVKGGLNAVTTSFQPMSVEVKESASPYVYDMETKELTVAVRLDMSATNGYVGIHYNADVMTPVEDYVTDMTVSAARFMDGVIYFDFANFDMVPAGSDIVILTFITDDPAQTIEVEPLEINSHKLVVGNVSEPTCTEEGNAGDLICVICGEIIVPGESIPAYCPAESYTDLDVSKWYHDGVCFVIRNGIMEGVGEATFAPDAYLTRAEMVTMLYRVAGAPSVEGLENPFADVAADKWYTDAIIWAANSGITAGVDATTFAPCARVTREQVVVFLYRFAALMGMDVSVDENTNILSYTDAVTISSWAVEAMQWALDADIINGMTEDTLAPKDNATRAQIATIIMRLLTE